MAQTLPAHVAGSAPHAHCSSCRCCPLLCTSTRWWPAPTSSSGKHFGLVSGEALGLHQRQAVQQRQARMGQRRKGRGAGGRALLRGTRAAWMLGVAPHGAGCRPLAVKLADPSCAPRLLCFLCVQEDAPVQLDVRAREWRSDLRDDCRVGDRDLREARPLQPAPLGRRRITQLSSVPTRQPGPGPPGSGRSPPVLSCPSRVSAWPFCYQPTKICPPGVAAQWHWVPATATPA